jgi:hypothetical protein
MSTRSHLSRSQLYISLLAAAVLGLTACTDAEPIVDGEALPPSSVDLDSDDIVLTSALETLGSCDELLARIKAEALERVGPYGFDQGGFPGGVRLGEDMASEGAAREDMARANDTETEQMAAPASTTAASPGVAADESAGSGDTTTTAAAGPETSGTNNQEVGVDEADLVKTDGERLVVLSNGLLRVIDVTGPTPVLTRQIRLPDDTAVGELFLEGDRALLMSSGWTDQPFVGDTIPSDWYPGSPTGRLLEVDLVQGEVTRTLEFEGGYLSAREVDGTIRIVVSAAADRFAFVYPSNESATESAEAANRALIEDSTIDQWLPTFEVTENGTTVSSGPLVDCTRVHLPSEFAGFGSLVLLTVDLSEGLDVADATAVFTDAQTIYASPSVVAVATPRWPTYRPDGTIVDNEDAYTTAVHTFDITDPAQATYLASGQVPGHLLNQYSMSEHDGYLRVATTGGSWWGGNTEAESFVTILGRVGNSLEPVGQVGGMGKGEQIFAVRFMGPKAYVVTFRQTDPLYSLDLSDPANPRVTGELKIPGFSSYLHPLDESHMLGVGTDGDDQGATFGTVVSLFDVSDPANPTRTDKLTIAGGDNFDAGSYTPVAGDARAFTYWQDRAVVPVTWWRYDPNTGQQANGSDAVVVSVDPAGGLQEVGRLAHPSTQFCEGGAEIIPGQPQPLVEQEDVPTSTIAPGPSSSYCYTQAPEIVRSIVIGEDLFTVSNAGVAVHGFDSLQPITWIPFG